MKSKAHFKTHPLHPILVGFPITFYFATFIFDLLAAFSADGNSFYIMAKYMNIAGVVSAVITAIPGFIDYLMTVPPKSSAKNRAAKHGLLNACVLILFSVILYFRVTTGSSIVAILGAEIVGLVLTLMAGWMGGTLVFRNHIGVVNRFANAGNLNEKYIDEKTGRIKVATRDELAVDQMKLVHINGKRIVIAKTETAFVAFDDHCTHRGGSLAGGTMICGTVQCPWHGSQFDVNNGQVKAGPATDGIKTYQTDESGNNIFLIM